MCVCACVFVCVCVCVCVCVRARIYHVKYICMCVPHVITNDVKMRFA